MFDYFGKNVHVIIPNENFNVYLGSFGNISWGFIQCTGTGISTTKADNTCHCLNTEIDSNGDSCKRF